MLCKEPGYKLYFWLETWRCNQCLTYWGYDVTALAGEAYPSSWTLKSLPAACQQSEVTATCRGGIPWRWCGYLGSNKVETVRSHKRNITKVHVAKIMLQRLIFNPCSCFLESEPWPPLEKPHCLPDPIPVKAVGIPWIITWKLGWFIAEEENSNFFFSSPAISVACSSFLFLPSPTLAVPENCITLSSPSVATSLSKQVLYKRTPTQWNTGLQKEKTLVNFN